MKAIIIGSGISGMTAGAYLSRDGYDVTIYEQFDDIGGVTSGIRKDGYYWDLGQLVLEGFGPGEQAGYILEELDLFDKVPIMPGDRGYSFPDFQIWKPKDYTGPFWRKEKLQDLFPEEAKGLDRYYKYYKNFYELITIARRAERSDGIAALFLKIRMYSRILPLLPKLKWSAQKMMDSFFSSTKLQAVFMSILADFVVRPSQFPGLGMAAVNPEPAFDCRVPLEISSAGKQPSYSYIQGGCRALIDILAESIKGNRGAILKNKTVDKINIENGTAAGVTLNDGTNDAADIVLASGGVKECFFSLVGKDYLPKKFVQAIEEVPLMESVFMVHLGIDFDPSEYQTGALCYYYLTYDIEGAVDKIQNGIYHEGDDGFLLYIPSMAMAGMSPDGFHGVTVYTIAPNEIENGSWEERKEEYTDKLLSLAEEIIPGLKKGKQTQFVLTPDDFKKRTHQVHHAFGGCAPVMGKKGGPHRTPIKNLWFIGAQSESGAGINNVIEGVWRTIRMIRKSK